MRETEERCTIAAGYDEKHIKCSAVGNMLQLTTAQEDVFQAAALLHKLFVGGAQPTHKKNS